MQLSSLRGYYKLQRLILCFVCRMPLSSDHLLFYTHLTRPATRGECQQREIQLCSFPVSLVKKPRDVKPSPQLKKRRTVSCHNYLDHILLLKFVTLLSMGPNSEHVTMNFKLNISKTPISILTAFYFFLALKRAKSHSAN